MRLHWNPLLIVASRFLLLNKNANATLKLVNHNVAMRGKPTLFHRAKSIEKHIQERKILVKAIKKKMRKDRYWQKLLKKNIYILTESIKKSCLIDPLTTNNTIYRDSLTLTLTN